MGVWLAFVSALFYAITAVLGMNAVNTQRTNWPRWVWLLFGAGLIVAVIAAFQTATQLQDADLQKRTSDEQYGNVNKTLQRISGALAKGAGISPDLPIADIVKGVLDKIPNAPNIAMATGNAAVASGGQSGGITVGGGNQGIITSHQSGNNTLIQNPQRHLTEKQIDTIGLAAQAMCNQQEKVSVTAANSNNEAQIYAADFIKGLNKAGCKADLELPIPGLEATAKGIIVGVRPWPQSPDDLKANNPSANSLVDALSAASVQSTLSPLAPTFFEGSRFILAIGGEESVSATRKIHTTP